jgi:hypothetical protein
MESSAPDSSLQRSAREAKISELRIELLQDLAMITLLALVMWGTQVASVGRVDLATFVERPFYALLQISQIPLMMPGLLWISLTLLVITLLGSARDAWQLASEFAGR